MDKSAADGSLAFERFWQLYPRKVAKMDAQKAWRTMTDSQRFAALESIPIHVRYWQLAGTQKEYLPYPASWCRGERWTDELEMPEPTSGNAWMKSESGIATKAAQVGVQARPGEGYQELRARILAKERG